MKDGSTDLVYKIIGIERFLQIKILWLIGGNVLFLYLSIKQFSNQRLLKYLDNRQNKFLYVLFYFALSLNCLALSIGQMYLETDIFFTFSLILYSLIIILVEIFLVATVIYFVPKWSVFFAASLCTLNFYSYYLCLNEAFLIQSVLLKCLIEILIFFIFLFIWILFVKYQSYKILLISIVPLFTPFFISTSKAPSNLQEINNKFSNIRLNSKPDIHLLSFDALITPALAKKFLKISDVPYEGITKQNEITIFKNAFVSKAPSKPALNSVMRLAHPEFYFDEKHSYDYYSGKKLGPLSALLIGNNYKIVNGYANAGMGLQGQYVHDYYPKPGFNSRKDQFCDLTASNSPILYSGFCIVIKKLIPKEFIPWPEKLKEIFEAGFSFNDPLFTLHYIGMPSHTGAEFNYKSEKHVKEYAREFYKNATTFTKYFSELIKVVGRPNRKKVVLVFGDHGTYVSRAEAEENNIDFIVKDKHGVLFMMPINETQCSKSELMFYSDKGYTTPERVIAALIRCHTDEKEKFDKLLKFSEQYEFSKFLYE